MRGNHAQSLITVPATLILGKIDRFERRITVAGDIDAALEKKLLEIADKCPVHRTLEAGAAVVTHIAGE